MRKSLWGVCGFSWLWYPEQPDRWLKVLERVATADIHTQIHTALFTHTHPHGLRDRERYLHTENWLDPNERSCPWCRAEGESSVEGEYLGLCSRPASSEAQPAHLQTRHYVRPDDDRSRSKLAGPRVHIPHGTTVCMCRGFCTPKTCKKSTTKLYCEPTLSLMFNFETKR